MTSRSVLLAGATGLVGAALLDGLLADASVTRVVALARRPLARHSAPGPAQPDLLRSDKLSVVVVDFAALPALPPVDEVYLALGTTIKVAGSQPAFRAVDFDANLAVARAALAAGARRAGLVSAMGADARSRVFYSRVKGELEEALCALPFDGIVIARPSLLVGDRASLGQPARPGEQVGEAVARVLGPLVPARLRPIRAAAVAAALQRRVPSARGRTVLRSDEMWS